VAGTLAFGHPRRPARVTARILRAVTLPELDPGGPADPALAPQPVTEVDRLAAFTLMAAGWWPPVERITQA
jgi:hypothetical protein